MLRNQALRITSMLLGLAVVVAQAIGFWYFTSTNKPFKVDDTVPYCTVAAVGACIVAALGILVFFRIKPELRMWMSVLMAPWTPIITLFGILIVGAALGLQSGGDLGLWSFAAAGAEIAMYLVIAGLLIAGVPLAI